MLLRQHGGWYNYPDHVRGLSGVVRRLLYRLGFDPLTVYERLNQVDIERAYWKEQFYAQNPDEVSEESH